MAEIQSLVAEERQESGTGGARLLRREGKIPAVIYGKGRQNRMVAVNAHDVQLRVTRGTFFTHTVDLQVNGETVRVVPRDVSVHPVTEAIEHIDFLYADHGATVTLQVPFRIVGREKAPGLRLGGMLNMINRSLLLRGPAQLMPHHVDVDVSHLRIGDRMRLPDIVIPEGVEVIASDKKMTVLTVAGRGRKGQQAGAESA
jgi:large subunit ribosomal protein L25